VYATVWTDTAHVLCPDRKVKDQDLSVCVALRLHVLFYETCCNRNAHKPRTTKQTGCMPKPGLRLLPPYVRYDPNILLAEVPSQCTNYSILSYIRCSVLQTHSTLLSWRLAAPAP
jgi:hypothetical protein